MVRVPLNMLAGSDEMKFSPRSSLSILSVIVALYPHSRLKAVVQGGEREREREREREKGEREIYVIRFFTE